MGDAPFRDASRALDTGLRAAIRESGGTTVEAKTLGDEFVARRLNRLPDGRMELVADGVLSWRYPLVEGHMPSVLHRIIWQSSKV